MAVRTIIFRGKRIDNGEWATRWAHLVTGAPKEGMKA